MTTWIGIDPGLSGAVARVTDAGQADVFDVPTVAIKRGKSTKRMYEGARIAEQVAAWAPRPTTAFIEDVHAMPGQGSVSMFTFGYGYGMWVGVLYGLGVPFERVTPMRWKAEMLDGLPKGKDASRVKAMELFPQLASQLSLKKHEGRAEALLIAEWGRRHSR